MTDDGVLSDELAEKLETMRDIGIYVESYDSEIGVDIFREIDGESIDYFRFDTREEADNVKQGIENANAAKRAYIQGILDTEAKVKDHLEAREDD